jgi:ABC-type Fe3+/spermidine/putrescine transport system ATPase subunit
MVGQIENGNYMQNNKSYILVSISSAVMRSGYVNNVVENLSNNHEKIDLIFLDDLEINNQCVINRYEKKFAKEKVESLINEILGCIKTEYIERVDVRRWNSYMCDELKVIIGSLSEKYSCDKSFKSACDNQVYVNMQPILNKMGVYNRRNEIISKLALYIISELALKIFLNNSKYYDIEYAPYKEMQVMEEMFNHKWVIDGLNIDRYVDLRIIAARQRKEGIVLRNIKYAYPKKDVLFNDLNINMPGGEVIGILGKNGSGKTTILNLIGGHIRPISGNIYIGGDDITNNRPKDRPVITVFQDNALFPHMTVFNNVSYGLRVKKMKRDFIEQKVNMLLSEMDIIELKDRYPSELSLGQQKRVAICRSIIMNPKVLLLDEPSSSLDYEQREKLIKIIKNLSINERGMSIIIISHDRDFIISVCDYLVYLNNGEALVEEYIDKINGKPPNYKVALMLNSMNVIDGRIDDQVRFVSKINKVQYQLSDDYSDYKNMKAGMLINRGFESSNSSEGIFLEVLVDSVIYKKNSKNVKLLIADGTELIFEVSGRDVNIFKDAIGRNINLAIEPKEICVLV